MSNEINRIFDSLNVPIQSNLLPTISDVIKAICFERKNKKVSKKDGINFVANKVFGLWKKTGIPFVSMRRVKAKVEEYFNRYDALFGSVPSRTKTKSNVKEFKVRHSDKFIWRQFV